MAKGKAKVITTQKAKAKGGRPEIPVNEETVLALAQRFCFNTEIAAIVGISVDTLHRRFAEIIAKGREAGKANLRRLQFEAADRGNTAMLIFLGKNYLGQADRHELTGAEGSPLIHAQTSTDTLIERALLLLGRGEAREMDGGAG